jgi:hypothetical protein
VNKLIERSITEGKKRKVIESRVSDNCIRSEVRKIELMSNLPDFDEFPKYGGRGVSEMAPDLQGSLEELGEITLVLRYIAVDPDEYADFMTAIEKAGFTLQGKTYFKYSDTKTYEMALSYSEKEGRMRVFHRITYTKKEENKQ